MKKPMVLIFIIVIIILVIVGTVVGYLYYKGFFNSRHGRFPRGNFQLNQSQIDDVTSFFSSNPTEVDMNSYCQQNRRNCAYYCINIDKNNNYCNQIMNFTKTGNYSGNGTRKQGGMPPMPSQP